MAGVVGLEIDKTTAFTIDFKNTGKTPARNLVITDRVEFLAKTTLPTFNYSDVKPDALGTLPPSADLGRKPDPPCRRQNWIAENDRP
jgi:hypothetical protein